MQSKGDRLSAAALVRAVNTTLRMPQEPAFTGYNLSDAFGPLSFLEPVALASPPGETNRLFIVERPGRISVITNLAQPLRSTFLDLSHLTRTGNIESGLLGLAFHPGFATNRYFYIFQTRTFADIGYANLVVRYQASALDPGQALLETETVIMKFPDPSDEHNAGDLHFGPDGYLYIPMGDIGLSLPSLENLQPLDESLFGAILRIDVDHRPMNLAPNPLPGATLNYRIPADNPFIDITNYQGFPISSEKLRSEFYAIGMRNPWRMSFDSATGLLLCGDVGGAEVEEVDVITRGGNYGWPYREGTRTYLERSTVPADYAFQGPLVSYTHGRGTNQGMAVIGGVVYRGAAIPELFGRYVFADNVSGHIFVTDPLNQGSQGGFHRIMGETGIAGFGIDPRNQDILVVNNQNGSLKRLRWSPAEASNVPATLALAGVFSDLRTLAPHLGVVPYELNLPFWSDGAIKSRFFSVPDTNQSFTFSANGNWLLPSGTVWIKHFEMEMTNGVPESRRRLETRILVKQAGGAYGVTYKWDETGTDATLVEESGRDEELRVWAGNTSVTQRWRYPSRGECLTCHTREGGYALGFNTPQLNVHHAYGSPTDNQIQRLAEAGYLSNPPPDYAALVSLALSNDTNAPLEFRVRSYFAANCAPCHQTGGTSTLDVFWDGRITSTLEETRLLRSYIVPGDAAQSRVLQRLSTVGNLMPPVGTSVVNTNAVNLITEWVNSFPPSPWNSKDVGAADREGSSRIYGPTYVISGAGAGTGSKIDGFHFLYQSVTGHVQLIAKVLSHQAPYPSSQAGLMIRAGVDAADPFGMLFLDGSGELRFLSRALHGSEAIGEGPFSSEGSRWLKLVREGTSLRGFVSHDSSSWRLLEERILPVENEILAGFAVSSSNPYQYNTAVFTNFSLLCARLATPDAGSVYTLPARIPIAVAVTSGSNRVQKVSFFADSVLIGEATKPPYEFIWTNGLAGDHRIGAVVTDVDGSELLTENSSVRLEIPLADAFPIQIEPYHQGNWLGSLGSDGSIIVGDSTNVPPSIGFNFTGVTFQEWQVPPDDLRALMRVGGTERVAAGLEGADRWTLEVDFADGRLHELTVYCVDWDGSGLQQTITVMAADSGEVLDRREVSDFHDGRYLRWVIRGRVRLVFTAPVTAGAAVISGVFFDNSGNKPPAVSWVVPQPNQRFTAPVTVPLWVDTTDVDGRIAKVEFFANEVKVGEVTDAPFYLLWEKPNTGDYELVARAVDNLRDVTESAPLQLSIERPTASAQFIGIDPEWGGNWLGRLGQEGYHLPNAGQRHPPYLRLTENATRSVTWDDWVSDPRALLHDIDDFRIASCWVFAENSSLDISLDDGYPRVVSCYFLDWDGFTRRQVVTISDPARGIVLDTREVTDFHDGKYFQWLVHGRVELRILPLQGNGVVSGIFFDSYSPQLIHALRERADGSRSMILTWASFPGHGYSIEYTTDLVRPNWVRLLDKSADMGVLTQAEIELDRQGSPRFFRVFTH